MGSFKVICFWFWIAGKAIGIGIPGEFIETVYGRIDIVTAPVFMNVDTFLQTCHGVASKCSGAFR